VVSGSSTEPGELTAAFSWCTVENAGVVDRDVRILA